MVPLQYNKYFFSLTLGFSWLLPEYSTYIKLNSNSDKQNAKIQGGNSLTVCRKIEAFSKMNLVLHELTAVSDLKDHMSVLLRRMDTFEGVNSFKNVCASLVIRSLL